MSRDCVYTRSRIVITEEGEYQSRGETHEYLLNPHTDFEEARELVALLSKRLNGVFHAKLVWEEP
jgi:hypothetical protein